MGYARGMKKHYAGKEAQRSVWTEEHSIFVKGLLKEGVTRKRDLVREFRSAFRDLNDPGFISAKIEELKQAHGEDTRAAMRVTPRLVDSRPNDGCCWPIGHPGEAEFRFCGAPAEKRKPYCPQHAQKSTDFKFA